LKYRLYIDEVGNSDLGASLNPNHRYLSLTGVILELENVASMIMETKNDPRRGRIRRRSPSTSRILDYL
jgi:hypothetical protein